MCNRKCGYLFDIIVGLILGLLIGHAYYIGLITGIITSLWIALGIAGIAITILFILIIFYRKEIDKRMYDHGKCLALGTLGTLVLSIAALSITLVISSIGMAIFIGFIGAFVVISILSMTKLVCCLIDAKCKYTEE